MSLFETVKLPQGPDADAVRAYLEAQDQKDFSRAGDFFADDVVWRAQ